jgi:DNA helicase-2/ATP-dependent DNA helicase PcrA
VQDLTFFKIVVERYSELDVLLADLTLDPNVSRQAEGGPSQSTEGLRPLTISTIHSAKGLEWDDVTLLGLDDRTLPSPWAVKRAQEEGETAGLEEEKRLLYVAVTRAAERLRIVHVLFGRQGMHRISRFLQTPAVLATLGQREGSAAPSEAGSASARRRSALLDALSGDDF